MEVLLQELDTKIKPQASSSRAYEGSFKAFLEVLKSWDARRIEQGNAFEDSGDGSSSIEGTEINSTWLIEKCTSVAKLMSPQQMAGLIIEACRSQDFDNKLFEILGADEVSLNLLFEEIAPNAEAIAKISMEEEKVRNNANMNNGAIVQEEKSSDDLLREYEEAATLATIARVQIRHIESQHIQRDSDKIILKEAKAAIKRASILKSKLPFRPEELDKFNFSNVKATGTGVLAPAGTKQFYEESKLPSGTEQEMHDGYELFRCPPPMSHYEELSRREAIVLDDVMGGELREIFTGVERLNPMQSGVFDYAFKNRGNMLVCAPTGAGMFLFYTNYIPGWKQ